MKEYIVRLAIYVQADNEDDAIDQVNRTVSHTEYQIFEAKEN
jgi:hypothetical protein